MKIQNKIIWWLTALFLMQSQFALGATTLLPNGKQCFTDANGPIISGSINMFIPGTTTPKATWQDSGQVTLNSQPLQLDANGCAVIYGTGIYRQQLYDGPVVLGVTTGNLIWDQPSTDTSAFNSVFWAGISAGTPNALTVVDSGFNGTDGTVIQFIALATNTASATLNPSGFGNILIQKSTTSGPVSLTGGEIVAGNVISVVYGASANSFTILNLITAAASVNQVPLCGAIGLKIFNDTSLPNNKSDITADSALMVTATGSFINRSTVSASVNFTTTGAGGLDTGSVGASTWYNIYLIDNGIAPAGLASLSASAPTMPSGYSYRCRLGAVPTDSSSNLFRTMQNGSVGHWVGGTTAGQIPCRITNGVQGTFSTTSPTLAAFSIAANGACAPPTATGGYFTGLTFWKGATRANVIVAPSISYSGANNGPSGSNGVTYPIYIDTVGNNVSAWMTFETTSIYFASDAAGGALFLSDWKDKVNAN